MDERKQYNQRVGFLSEVMANGELVGMKLEISLPFLASGEFKCYPPKERKNNGPAFVVHHKGCVIGTLWKKQTEGGEDYYSGNVFFVLVPGQKLYFNAFRVESDKKTPALAKYAVSLFAKKEDEEDAAAGSSDEMA